MQVILVLPLAGNNLILWGRGNLRRGFRRDATGAVRVSRKMLRLKDFRGPGSEIVDEKQILLAGPRYGPVVGREHTPDGSGFSHEWRGLHGSDACI